MTGDGLGRGLSDMWRSVLLFIPAALAFAAIVLVGYLVARLLRTAVTKGLHRAGLDRAVERGAAGRVLGSMSASELCGKLAFYAVLLFALQLAFGIWGPNPVGDLLTDVIAWLPRAFVAIVIIVVAAAVARAAQELTAGALGGLAYGRLLARAVSGVIVTLGVIAALEQVRIATAITQPLLIAVLATVAGVVIVGVGGGLIRPMQQRWEVWLDRAGAESATIREHARAYADQRRAAPEEGRPAPAPEAHPVATPPAADETQVIPPLASTGPGAAASGDTTIVTPVSAGGGTSASGDTTIASPISAAGGASASGETTIVGPEGAGETAEPAEGSAPDSGDTTVLAPGPNDTLVIGGGPADTERTQVIPPSGPVTTRRLPDADDDPPGR